MIMLFQNKAGMCIRQIANIITIDIYFSKDKRQVNVDLSFPLKT